MLCVVTNMHLNAVCKDKKNFCNSQAIGHFFLFLYFNCIVSLNSLSWRNICHSDADKPESFGMVFAFRGTDIK